LSSRYEKHIARSGGASCGALESASPEPPERHALTQGHRREPIVGEGDEGACQREVYREDPRGDHRDCEDAAHVQGGRECSHADGPDVPASFLAQRQSQAIVRSPRSKLLSRSCVVVPRQSDELAQQWFGGQANGGGISAKMGAAEEPARPILDVAALESCQQRERDFRGVRDRLQHEPATLPLISQTPAELAVGGIQELCRCSISHRGLTAPSELSSNEAGWRRRQPFVMPTKDSATTIRTPIAALVVSIRG